MRVGHRPPPAPRMPHSFACSSVCQPVVGLVGRHLLSARRGAERRPPCSRLTAIATGAVAGWSVTLSQHERRALLPDCPIDGGEAPAVDAAHFDVFVKTWTRGASRRRALGALAGVAAAALLKASDAAAACLTDGASCHHPTDCCSG